MTVRTPGENLRLAELTARTGLEPELAQRYATNPATVLAEFGVSTMEPPRLMDSTTIEHLDEAADQALALPTRFCFAHDPHPVSTDSD